MPAQNSQTLKHKNQSLQKMFDPNSIAVIGASRDKKKLGFIVLRNLVESGFLGRLIPINPKAKSILGLKCYASVLELKKPVELAIISLPSKLVLQTLEQINQANIKNVVIFSAGFKEIGYEGNQLEQDLVNFARENDINILGPNCLGFVNNKAGINATFAKVVNKPGPLKFISQSGAISSSIFDWAEHCDLGFSDFVTLGNKAVLTENEILEYWQSYLPKSTSADTIGSIKSKNYSPIGMYLESIPNGIGFLQTARELAKSNPLFILKPGKSKSAKKAMQSHTGSIAGEDYVLQTALKQNGIIRCTGLQQMFDLCKAFSWVHAPKGKKVVVISNAGGPAVITADLIEEYGLELAKISEKTKKDLTNHLPGYASLLNPIDVLGDALADRYQKALEAVLQENVADSILVILTPQLMTETEKTAQIISKLAKKHEMPIVCSFIGGNQVAKGQSILDKHKVPSFGFPREAVDVLEKMTWWYSWAQEYKNVNFEKYSQIYDKGLQVNANSAPEVNTISSLVSTSDSASLNSKIQKIQNIITQAKQNNQKILTNFESNEILNLSGIKTPATANVKTYEDAYNFVEKEGFPVVLKISSQDVLHKKDIGGVVTNINTLDSLKMEIKRLRSTFEKQKIADAQIQIQEQITEGIELIVGIKKDLSFGYVLMFGAGGTFAELIKDRNLYLLPFTKNSHVKHLIENSKINKIIKGYRGDKAYNIEPLIDLIKILSDLTLELQEFEAFEINPVILTHKNTYAVDGKVILN